MVREEETINYMVDVLLAAKQGKQIQILIDGVWVNVLNPDWNFGKSRYRAAPALVTGYINIFPTFVGRTLHLTRAQADAACSTERVACVFLTETKRYDNV
ncbi:MAG: hypothetical protein ABI162_06830 [Luteolibacter sp.]